MTTLQEAAQRALHDAATSLETIGRLAGKTHYVGDDGERIETYMGHHDQVRGYAQSRAAAAREALAALASEPQAEPVATLTISVDGSTTTIDCDWGAAVRHWPVGTYPLYTHPAPPVEQPAAPDLNSVQLFWIENRTKILDGIDAAGYVLMSNQDGFWLMKKGSPAATQGAKT